jgi:hypothetical protein
MTTGPGDELEAAGRSHLRASDADREQVISTLKAAFIQGRLTRDELDLRVGQTLASRTYAELAAVAADLPTGLAAAQPPMPAQEPGERRVLRPGPVITAASVLYAGWWVYAIFSAKGGDSDGKGGLIFLGSFVYMIILAICVGQMVALRERRSSGQLPGRPAPGGGQPSQRLPSADLGRQLPPADPGHHHTAEAAPRRHPRPPLPGSQSLRRWHPRMLPADQRPAITPTA